MNGLSVVWFGRHARTVVALGLAMVWLLRTSAAQGVGALMAWGLLARGAWVCGGLIGQSAVGVPDTKDWR